MGPPIISRRNRVAQIYPWALGSLSVASYDSEAYGGGILSRLHTGNVSCQYLHYTCTSVSFPNFTTIDENEKVSIAIVTFFC
jgi:hypothetical protein